MGEARQTALISAAVLVWSNDVLRADTIRKHLEPGNHFAFLIRQGFGRDHSINNAPQRRPTGVKICEVLDGPLGKIPFDHHGDTIGNTRRILRVKKV